jgi:hypothetical protein
MTTIDSSEGKGGGQIFETVAYVPIIMTAFMVDSTRNTGENPSHARRPQKPTNSSKALSPLHILRFVER